MPALAMPPKVAETRRLGEIMIVEQQHLGVQCLSEKRARDGPSQSFGVPLALHLRSSRRARTEADA